MGTSLENGIAAAKAGNKKNALQFFRQAIKENPRDVNAWLWASSVYNERANREYCLKKVLEIDPNNEYALQGLGYSPIYTEPSTAPRRQIAQIPPSNVIQTKNTQPILGWWGIIGLGLFLSYMILFPFSAFINSKELGEFAMMLGFGWGFHYVISGYVGAFKLIKGGQIMQLVGCSILLGGLPILLPAVLGYFLLWYANWSTSPKT